MIKIKYKNYSRNIISPKKEYDHQNHKDNNKTDKTDENTENNNDKIASNNHNKSMHTKDILVGITVQQHILYKSA